MKTIDLPIEKIEPNPANYRKLYQGIEKLADSIATYGLLQNLIVFEYEPGKYQVKGGERRRRAIMILKERKHPAAKEPVRCVLLSQFTVEDVIENLREDPASWELGARLYDMYEKDGLTQTQIASHIGRSQVYVSMCIRFFTRIHPTIRAYLSKVGPDCLSQKQLERLACAVDMIGDPIEEKQFDMMVSFLDVKTKSTNKRPSGDLKREREMLLTRARHLIDGSSRGVKVPTKARDTYDKIIAYLRGETKRLKLT
jgi:ParB/RepB/Spo0J family partition protein